MRKNRISRSNHYILSFMLLMIVIGCAPQKEIIKADLVLVNGQIWTGNKQLPAATALAVKADTFLMVGDNNSVKPLIGPETRIVDGGNYSVLPGFIDTHVHFLEGGFRLSSVLLRTARTPEEFISRIKAYADQATEGEWITGGDWDHEQWGGELPVRQWIDSVSPNNPVWVNRLDGHMSLANSLALKLAGVTSETADIKGGTIVRDQQGMPTGIFKDNATVLIDKVVPDQSPAQKNTALKKAMDYVSAQGVTSVHSVGSWGDLEVYKQAHQNRELTTRIYAGVPLSSWQRLEEKIDQSGQGDDQLRVGLLKGFVDGSLGSHTAAFFEPFDDDPDNKGLMVNSEQDLYQWTKNADQAGLQVAIHAIGDRANHVLLNIYEKVIDEDGEKDRRFRIEHAQHLQKDDIPRFSKLGIIPCMQPYHAIDDGRWAEKVIGDRIQTTYAFKDLFESGAKVAFGSDWFVAPPTPLEGIYAAVTRRTLDGKNPEGWVPEQKITLDQALEAYTINAAYASFEEDKKGSIEVGKLADFVLLSDDLFYIPPEYIKDLMVLMTVVGGRVVYELR